MDNLCQQLEIRINCYYRLFCVHFRLNNVWHHKVSSLLLIIYLTNSDSKSNTYLLRILALVILIVFIANNRLIS